MGNYLNTENCQINEPRETAKMILGNTDVFLDEIGKTLEMVFSSITGERRDASPSVDPGNGDISMMDALRRQRATAERIFKIVTEIKEALW